MTAEGRTTHGVLIVPETARLFIGAGERLLAYDLNVLARLWEDSTSCGYWRWGVYPKWVWMAGELEFAVWSTTGEKLWSVDVEPPWSESFAQDIVELDVIGLKTRRRLSDGKELWCRPGPPGRLTISRSKKN